MNLLQIHNISKKFGGLQAVDRFNLELDKGEIVGLIGPNGAGKTTIFNLLTGVHSPDYGQVSFMGRNINHLKPYDICKAGIARTFQVVKPFLNRTVLFNVTVGSLIKNCDPKEAEKRALNILEFTDLLNKKDMLAKSLTIADRKRLEIARALATEPTLILLDETMAGLNPAETEMAINLVKKISKEMDITILLIEHIMQVVMTLSDRVAVLNYGKKIAEGCPIDISKNKEVIKAYLGEEYATIES
jgi:branched-chain amino acid transport system ATP-binding protein